MRLGKFEIVRLLAQGSMGEVYLGRDPIIGREVAIKVIHTSAGMAAGSRERFANEARAAGVLNHPNIVTVYEMGEEQGVLYLAMELVKGEDLATLIRGGNLTPRDVLDVLAQVCDGLAVAHRHQILHRDLKPSNIRVIWDGKTLLAKLLDFGVAKVVNSDSTDEGTVFGTVNYMAPEYLQSGHSDGRSDLFGIGVILYEALAGLPPFDGPSPGSIIYRLLHENPGPLPPTAFQGISRDVQALLNRSLAKDPANRFQSAEELAAALRAARDTNWSMEQERPTLAMIIRRSVAGRPAATTPPRGFPAQHPPRRSSIPEPAVRATEQVFPAGSTGAPEASPPRQQAEVRRDLLMTSRHQLLQALEMDSANARILALLLATHYRLGWPDAVMQTLRQAQSLGIPARSLQAVPRCAQVIQEEAQACRLPMDHHGEFMEYLGG